MKSLDRAFLKTARLPRSKLAALSADSASGLERAMARICLALDYPGQKREANGQFGTGKKPDGGSPQPDRHTKASRVARGRITQSKFKGDRRKPKFSAREIAAVHHELNTHLMPAEREQGVVTKNLFGSYYTVEIIDFDEYNIISRVKADNTQASYLKEFRKGGKKQ